MVELQALILYEKGIKFQLSGNEVTVRVFIILLVQALVSYKKKIKVNLSGNEVYYANCLIFLVTSML